jgi:tetratricopeptide (TPR) repeat protein
MRSVTINDLSIFLILLLQLLVQNVAGAECKESTGCPEVTQFEEFGQTLNEYRFGQALNGYREAMVIGEFGEAENLAKLVMELSIVLNGRDTVYSANALTNLAYVQYRQEKFETSRLNLRAAIKTIEEIGGNLSADLIRPLHRLGQTELALGEVDSATELFQRAVHIGHVQNGPQNTEQIESLEAIAKIYLKSNNIKEARNIQKSILAYRARADGPESEEYLPALKHHADWMHRLQLYNRERNTYYKMLEIQESHHGQDDPSLIPIMILLGISFHEIGFSRFDDNYVRLRVMGHDHYLNRAMKIAADHPQSDWELFAHTALEVGDYYTRVHRYGRARSAYNDAWQQLSIEPAGLAERSQEMESPKLLAVRPLPEYYEDENPLYEPDTTDEFLRGAIIAEFDVTRTGESVNIKLVESKPPGLTKIEKRLVRALRSVMHRPRMEDGSMIDTQQLTYVYEFSYRESDTQN